METQRTEKTVQQMRWRVVAVLPLIAEPMVDWFTACDADGAIAAWREVAAEIGLPAEKARVSASLGAESWREQADAQSTQA